jgi:hypothetical protein
LAIVTISGSRFQCWKPNHFVGDEERAVLPAELLGSGEVVVGGILDSFSLDGLKDEGGDLTGLEFLFEIFEISELHKVCTG